LVVGLTERSTEQENVSELGIRYLNRLSDALFVWGRWAALKDGQAEPLWEPRTT
jgi:cob(I)alamin adenosyltransferase